MRRFRILHVLLLIASAAVLVWPVFLDKKKEGIGFLYVLDSFCIAGGASTGLISSAFNVRRGKPWAQPWSRVEIFGELVSVLYWIVTGGCVGGVVGFLGGLGVTLLAAGSIVIWIFLPLLFLVPIAAIAVPILACAVVPVLVLLIDVRNT